MVHNQFTLTLGIKRCLITLTLGKYSIVLTLTLKIIVSL